MLCFCNLAVLRLCGITGLATSFFNEKNRNMAVDLVELITETRQELPDWLAALAKEVQVEHRSNNQRKYGARRYFMFLDFCSVLTNILKRNLLTINTISVHEKVSLKYSF